MLTYTHRYNRVIQWFKAHKPFADILCEKHHIIPMSMGGDNSPENLIDLPIRWHYIVHCWLPAMYAEQGNQEGYEKMLFAWNRMQNYRRGHRNALKCVKEDSELYRRLREEYLLICGLKTSISQSGFKNSQYGTHWWKDPNDSNKSMKVRDGDPVPEGWVRGRWTNVRWIQNVTTGGISQHKEDEILPEGYVWYERKKSRCKVCGAEKHTCSHPEICRKYQLFDKLIRYFGFDESAIGTERVVDEFNHAKQTVINMYYVQKMSIQQICDVVGYTHGASNFWHFLNGLLGKGFARSVSEAGKIYHQSISTISHSSNQNRTCCETLSESGVPVPQKPEGRDCSFPSGEAGDR